ncbi:MAG: GNAT family protein [Anaerobacillus sp.]
MPQGVRLVGNKTILRRIEEEDIPTLWNMIYGEKNPEWKNWDAPYFNLDYIDEDTFRNVTLKKLGNEIGGRLIIEVNDQIIGMVSYYWEHEPSRWLEVGIVIYLPEFWSKGYGSEALQQWIDYVFRVHPEIERVGLTTWSGNRRMIKAAENIGMQLEGRMRKCRYFDGTYYDSIRMGVLREE